MTAELVREAIYGDRCVAHFRCYDDRGGSAVEAQVTPVDGGEPVNRGPYWFPTAHDAFRFLQEASLALQYLGCTVS